MNNLQTSDALSTLATLDAEDEVLRLITRELNLYAEVLRLRGQRYLFSPADLRVVFNRMLDVATIQPVSKSNGKDRPIDLDQPIESDAPPAFLAIKDALNVKP
jgi:hypothetical protein